jgi:hypothetical protein
MNTKILRPDKVELVDFLALIQRCFFLHPFFLIHFYYYFKIFLSKSLLLEYICKLLWDSTIISEHSFVKIVNLTYFFKKFTKIFYLICLKNVPETLVNIFHVNTFYLGKPLPNISISRIWIAWSFFSTQFHAVLNLGC